MFRFKSIASEYHLPLSLDLAICREVCQKASGTWSTGTEVYPCWILEFTNKTLYTEDSVTNFGSRLRCTLKIRAFVSSNRCGQVLRSVELLNCRLGSPCNIL